MNTPAGPNDAVLSADGLGKTFRIYPTPWSRAAEWLSFGRRTTHTPFVALDDVSFTLRRGESLGVIGVNGSGKSTLLKILSGALHPTDGRCDVRGRVLSLLELGTGVNPQLTGRQNVLASAELLGFPPGYAAEKLPDIETFADLPDAFFDRPVSLYSSGMLVRLVFSMFACFEPDVFIVDEALSVGDVFFQQKCARRLQAMREAGTTMLFVSHDLAAVEALCDRVLVLHGGTVRHLGDKQTGIRLYYALSGAADPRRGSAQGTVGSSATSAAADHPATPGHSAGVGPDLPAMHPPLAESSDLGDGRVRILAVGFRREDAAETPIVHQGQWLQVVVQCQATADVGPVNGGIAIVDRFDRLLFARGWINAGLQPVWLKSGERFTACFRLNVDLEPGEYSLTLSAAEPLQRDGAPGGWDQDVGGARYAEVKHAGKIAVLPRPDGAKTHYGPSPLASELTFAVEPATPGGAATAVAISARD